MRTFFLAVLLCLAPAFAWSADVLSAVAARKAALAGELTLVDIRRPEEWKATGLPDVAHALDMSAPGFAAKLLQLYQAHPDRPMALICASGARSTYVATALEQRGLTRIVNIREGMTGSKHGPGWLARNLPIRKPTQERVQP